MFLTPSSGLKLLLLLLLSCCLAKGQQGKGGLKQGGLCTSDQGVIDDKNKDSHTIMRNSLFQNNVTTTVLPKKKSVDVSWIIFGILFGVTAVVFFFGLKYSNKRERKLNEENHGAYQEMGDTGVPV